MATLTTAFVPSKLNPLHSGYQVSPFAHITPLRKKINQPVARLFGPAIFEVSKLEVLFLGMDQKKHPADLPRTYTLTHSDITSKITLSISQTINNSQVLNAFSHGDKNLFKDYPELHDALVWVYFHSNISEFNKVECWGPLKDACAFPSGSHEVVIDGAPQSCQENCECCFIPMSSITWS
ncbi:hypothetical protein GLYMA_17G132800v4 [Glycine max]|nr:hypothetical protein GLYMA_17G132800v4 [Glycine max]KAH1118299.1 hypothetical protein GYH30_047167 [Glycine max]